VIPPGLSTNLVIGQQSGNSLVGHQRVADRAQCELRYFCSADTVTAFRREGPSRRAPIEM